MRHCEQYAARWQDVDFEHRFLTVPCDKGGRKSHVRLKDAALSALLRLREHTGDRLRVRPVSRSNGLVRGLSLNGGDYRLHVALPPPHFREPVGDGWRRPANRGRIAQG